jgi:tetratricopeptide (TPR) repeat protein
LIVARAFLILVVAWLPLLAQKPAERTEPPKHAEPEEEDATAAPKEYEFNPIQAENEIKVGRFYMKRGSFKAAAGRFEEGLKWNPQLAEAYLLLGEAREKLRDAKAAKAAYEKYLELSPQAKDASEIRKRVAGLKLPKS